MVRALLSTGTGWLALVVALNAVLGLAYYLRATAALFGPAVPVPPNVPARPPWPVAVAVTGVALAAVVVGVAPQIVLAAAHLRP